MVRKRTLDKGHIFPHLSAGLIIVLRCPREIPPNRAGAQIPRANIGGVGQLVYNQRLIHTLNRWPCLESYPPEILQDNGYLE